MVLERSDGVVVAGLDCVPYPHYRLVRNASCSVIAFSSSAFLILPPYFRSRMGTCNYDINALSTIPESFHYLYSEMDFDWECVTRSVCCTNFVANMVSSVDGSMWV
jgi:hypothetical protein